MAKAWVKLGYTSFWIAICGNPYGLGHVDLGLETLGQRSANSNTYLGESQELRHSTHPKNWLATLLFAYC